MTYEIKVTKEVQNFIQNLDKKSKRICKNNLKKLENHPRPGRGKGDKEKLSDGRYRIHIGRSFTAFYSVVEDGEEVRVSEIMTIDKAHKKYGYD